MKNIAGGLRPGGTFAAVLYWPFPSITNNDAASHAFQRLIANHVQGFMKMEWMSQAWQRGSKQLNMDCVPLRDETWQDVRRYYPRVPQLRQGLGLGTTPRRRGSHWHATPVAQLGNFQRTEDPDCGDWQLSTTVQWLKENLESLRFGFTVETWESKKWKGILDAVGDAMIKLRVASAYGSSPKEMSLSSSRRLATDFLVQVIEWKFFAFVLGKRSTAEVQYQGAVNSTRIEWVN
ncbi:hypothetical protein KVR01_013806 [Diaporthe batatas]|uniref:uncharacterized protein n=1 Tax=Diaporthe batatas TaxID=748121 RepID=UPI001D04EB26|nr:uncharacterized protein KVR01_013806 [Diaporthe batatas]KAG8156354.1 hypothetical protein KVR01_013806 [Diaporthe batatas]